MFGFGKKKSKPAKKSTARKAAPKRATTRKAASARKAAPARKTRALCVVCRERKQTNTTLRICGRKRCAAELRQRSQSKPAPAKPAAPRRAPATRRPKAPRSRTAPAAQPRPQTTPAATAPTMTGSELATWWKQAQASAQQSQIKDWNHHHRQHRDEIVHNAAALNQAAALLSGPDRAALNDIARTAAAITDDRISRAAEADTRAKRTSSIAPQLIALGDRLYALTAKYEQAGVIRVNRP